MTKTCNALPYSVYHFSMRGREMPLSRHDHEHPSPVLPCPEGSNWLPDLSRRIILFIKDPLPPLGTALRPYARSKEKRYW